MNGTGPGATRRSGAASAARPGLVIVLMLAAAAGLYLHMQSGDAVSGQARGPSAAADAGRQQLRDVDPALVKYRQVGQIDTGFREPRGIALGPDESLHVAGDEAIRVFGPDGTVQREMAVEAAPQCVAVDDAGAVYVGFRDHVAVYGPGGDLQTRWPPWGEHPFLTCLALSGDDVWVADAGDRVVLHYNRSGRLLGRIGQKDEGRQVPGLLVPSPHLDVAVAPSGLLVVNNPGRLAVEAYTADGELQSSWGHGSQAIGGFCGCCNPTDIAIFPDGQVATSEKGLPRVKVYGPDGALSCVVATPQDLSKNAGGMDLAIDGEGRVMVLDPPARAVRIFARKDQPSPEDATS